MPRAHRGRRAGARRPGRTGADDDSVASRGARPANASDVLPLPEAPTIGDEAALDEQLVAAVDDRLASDEQVGVVGGEPGEPG